MYDSIPKELRALAQWVTWRLEDHGGVKPTKVPYNPTTGAKASVNDPFSWTSYDTALAAAKMGWYTGIGFMLSDADPYTFIDLDDTHEDAVAHARQRRIFDAFASYSEISPSGKGLHIIVKGKVPAGRKRSFVEVYSAQRFMTMTGNVYYGAEIRECNELVNSLWEALGGQAVVQTYEGDSAEKLTDQQVLDMASAADNGAKFIELWYGKFAAYYTSQSEADFALINILAFYTQHKGQIVRLFRMSVLGQRPKALRPKYVNYMVERSFDRMLPQVDIDALKQEVENALMQRRMAANIVIATSMPVIMAENAEQLPPNLTAYPVAPPGIQLEKHALKFPEFVYEKPPGLLGDIATFIYAAAPRPVAEIALVGALALMSGICGRAYNISGMGLNQYIFLLAGTGSGKEAIASGIDKLMASLKQTVPASSKFIGPAEIASPEALLKYMDKTSNCFVSMIGEFAMKLKQMTSLGANPAQEGLKRLMLDLFNKSGEGKTVHPLIYSDSNKNTNPIDAPSFSIMGESAPEKFYEALNESMVTEGLLPRFTIVEYSGPRPALNTAHRLIKPDTKLIEQLSSLCGHALTLNQANRAIPVQQDEAAEKLFAHFDKYCDSQINRGHRDAIKQLWNRAHVKALKFAALVAVGNNPFNPTIDEWTADWAIKIVVHDTNRLLDRFTNGLIGEETTTETRQLQDVHRVMRQYLEKTVTELASYGVLYVHHNARVITYDYLSKRLLSYASFRQDRIGATNVLRRVLQIMSDRGEIQEINGLDRKTRFDSNARCFAVLNSRELLKSDS